MTYNCNVMFCMTATQNACNFYNFRSSNFIIAITLTISVRSSMDSAVIPGNIAPFPPVNITQWLKKDGLVCFVSRLCFTRNFDNGYGTCNVVRNDTEILCIQSFTEIKTCS